MNEEILSTTKYYELIDIRYLQENRLCLTKGNFDYVSGKFPLNYKVFIIPLDVYGNVILNIDSLGVAHFGIKENISDALNINYDELILNPICDDIYHGKYMPLNKYKTQAKGIIRRKNTTILVSVEKTDLLAKKGYTSVAMSYLDLVRDYYEYLNEDCKYIIDSMTQDQFLKMSNNI